MAVEVDMVGEERFTLRSVYTKLKGGLNIFIKFCF